MEVEHLAGMAKLFCGLGYHYDHLMLSGSDASVALIEGVLAITSHPDEEVHDNTFDFRRGTCTHSWRSSGVKWSV